MRIMLSYQHGYHAGNFADVIKHLALVHILNHMIQKEKPIFYLETHAGKGIYPLNAPETQKTQEFKAGILPVWNKREALSDAFKRYFEVIQTLNPSSKLETYPGSPYFAAQILRSQDRLTLCERHPQEFEKLKAFPKQGKRIHIACQDGLLALDQLLPPPEKRGLIFIDPSFEIKTEYRTLPKTLFNAYQRFPQGVFCLWYPIVKTLDHKQLTHKLKAQSLAKTLQIEFLLPIHPIQSNLYGMGIWVINPPHTLTQSLHSALSALCKIFPYQGAQFSIKEGQH